MTLSIGSIALLALAGFVAGLVDAIAGGGGLITLPALLAAGLPTPLALATNKGQATFGAISSAASFWRRDKVDRKRAPLAFIVGLVGSLCGALLLLTMSPGPLRPIVIVLLVFAAVVVAAPRPASKGPRAKQAMLWLGLIGFALGGYDGFFGPGVGSMLIALHLLLFGDTLTHASANAKIGNLASNLAALGIFAIKGAVLWQIALPMAVANALGAFAGARLAIAHGDKFVRVVVLLVVAAIVVKLGLDLAAARG